MTMIRDLFAERIAGQLAEIEKERGVEILYACESGSRGWGFASRDSDYDVRFIYRHPRDWYLSIEDGRDVIELPISDKLDTNGWDLRKALRLLRKSNPALLEWLSSPIVYREDAQFMAHFRLLARDYYFPTACLQHYLHMAKANHREYLLGDTVRLKKYFYVLRPVLACLWIEAGRGPVPMRFSSLTEALVDDPKLSAAIADLLVRKIAGDELESGPRISAISDFVEEQLARLGGKLPGRRPRYPDRTALEDFFRWALARNFYAEPGIGETRQIRGAT